MPISSEHARTWISRWDRQQETYVPHREERFTVLLDALEAACGRPDPLVLDLGCGPGSLAVRVLDRIPAATVVAVDADPLLLGLADAAHHDRPGLRFVEADLGRSVWGADLALSGPVDAAVSTTALHWLPEPELRVAYGELAGLLRPGGVLLNGDDLGVDDAAPGIAELERNLLRRAAGPRGESLDDWRQWWGGVTEDPALAELVARRGAGPAAGHRGAESARLSAHERALRAAGFAEVGTLWQHGGNRLVCAITGASMV
ncbi:class I SAM-dependent methyltransferase [Amycolatopsis sp. SID8362]|uniref:class I SAM-dependent methyltransferase n=1 Tax=Amycolatopsis sp. SID8362 TaxID=2690346 RepID=UPI00136F27AF|nr:class I SAM-dependent methyltransferase [Amycolatopsis sp. SID8362]NBH07465.1 methyltransferase domain-containing protein [Amycolatopsis sp. SID8362]NED44161.1 class I SAM-dependent methyltransferase [Amycolatopsis sp. SID8362]